jgi:hypothetical protein
MLKERVAISVLRIMVLGCHDVIHRQRPRQPFETLKSQTSCKMTSSEPCHTLKQTTSRLTVVPVPRDPGGCTNSGEENP